MIKNKRQIGTRLEDIRDDHRLRYEAAAAFAKEHGLRFAADVGCGAGYGSYILATQGDLCVKACDEDSGAIDYGQEHWGHESITRLACDLMELPLHMEQLLVMFEIIEHTHYAPEFLHHAAGWVPWLIGSVPNEDVVPFGGPKVHSQHVRHYTPDQLREMLTEAGWLDIRIGCQPGKRGDDAAITWDRTNGRTLVFTARS